MPTDNQLIALLPRADRSQLLSVCEQVELTPGHALSESGAPVRHVYFPNDGFVSLVAPVDQHAALEVGLVGREGMIGTQLAYGVVTAPLRAVVQGVGRAWRVDCGVLRDELRFSVPLQRILGRYTYVSMAQFALSMGCQRFHLLEARLARCLLMRHDRAQSDSFAVTHQLLGHTLGMRRVGVTVAAGVLQSAGLIAYSRGTLTVRDRRGLEGAACACYARDRQIYAESMRSAPERTQADAR